MTKDKALRLAEEAIMDDLEACTAEEFEDASDKLYEALDAIREALAEPTVSNSLKVQTQEALRMAEEAFNTHRVNADGDMHFNITKVEQALTAIRAALVDTVDTTEKCVEEKPECGHDNLCQKSTELVEPVAWMAKNGEVCRHGWRKFHAREEDVDRFCTPLYTTPQPRHDVTLTDGEIDRLWVYPDYCENYADFARAVIAKHKEKNK